MPYKDPKNKKEYMKDKTMITIKKTTRDKLNLVGWRTETFNDIVLRLIHFYEINGDRHTSQKEYFREKAMKLERENEKNSAEGN